MSYFHQRKTKRENPYASCSKSFGYAYLPDDESWASAARWWPDHRSWRSYSLDWLDARRRRGRHVRLCRAYRLDSEGIWHGIDWRQARRTHRR